jgi:hypothetical protein
MGWQYMARQVDAMGGLGIRASCLGWAMYMIKGIRKAWDCDVSVGDWGDKKLVEFSLLKIRDCVHPLLPLRHTPYPVSFSFPLPLTIFP